MNRTKPAAVAAFILAAFASLQTMADNSPWLSRVFDYSPAPGQFVNELPEYEEGDTAADMVAKAEEYICGQRSGTPVSLGAWGGYIVVGFDHRVANVAGVSDFKIYGNAFVGSAEPGIVEVSVDENGNGLPDDPWYQLKGSEYSNPATIHGFKATYYRPLADATAEKYIRMTDDAGNTMYVERVSAHTQPYWPQWLDAEILSFEGSRLPGNAADEDGVFRLDAFEWGYADNQPAGSDKGFDIGNAVDASGNPVELPGADFIKIYTGVSQQCGMIGETSTEICGAEDLHPDAGSGVIQVAVSEVGVRVSDGVVEINNTGDDVPYVVVSADGIVLLRGVAARGVKRIGSGDCGAGIRIFRVGDKIVRARVCD